MPKTDSDGAAIHYEISGNPDGPWLVFSNSLGVDLSFWDAQVAAFGGDYHIVRYDSRGHGKSDAPAGSYTMEQLGRDALAVMDAAGIDKAHYCGLSKGGMVGMWLGVNAPDRIERLVLSNTSSLTGPPEAWTQRGEAVMAGGMAAVAEAVVVRWFTQDFIDAQPATVERVRQMLLATPPQGYAGCCAAIRDMDQRETIRGITAPTLVIAGSRDPATPPEMGELVAERIPGARLVKLDAAHLSNIQTEAEFNAVVADFLKG